MNGAAPPTSSDPASNELVVAGSLPCIRCGYDLDKRSINTPCPECGSPASLSTESLWLEDPGYLRTVRRGINRMVIAALLGPALYLLAIAASFLGIYIPRGETAAALALGAGLAIGPMLAWHGADLLVRSRPGREHQAVHLRVGTRVIAAAYAVVYAISVFLPAIRSLGWLVDEHLLIGGLLVAGELWCARNLLVLAHVRSLAQISCMPRIAWLATILQFWAGALAVIGGMFGLAMLSGLRYGGPSAFIIVPYVVLVIGMLSWLLAWPVYLGRFGLGLKRMVREIERRGRPVIAPIAGAAPPTEERARH